MLNILSTSCLFISSITVIDCCSAPPPQIIIPNIQPNPVVPPQPPSKPRNNEMKEGPKMPDYCIQTNHNLCQNCFKVGYEPVCGNDGETYPNICSLKCEKCHGKDYSLEREFNGECHDDRYLQRDCFPKRLFSFPVCHEETGTTFRDFCSFQEFATHTEGVTLEEYELGSCSRRK